MSIVRLAAPLAARGAGVQRFPRWVAGLAAGLMIAWPIVSGNDYYVSVATVLALTMIGATSLHLIIRTGHISMAHAAFMGVAGYMAALAITRLALPFPVALMLGCLGAALLALVIGPIVLRLTGKYFVLFTFLFGEIIRLIFVEWSSLTGGSNGLYDIPAISPLFADRRAYYLLVLIFAGGSVALVARMLTGEVGRMIDLIREGEDIAKASGLPVLRIKVSVFMVACGLAGIQGVLQVFFLRYIDPTTFGVQQSLNLVIANVLGGMHTLLGPILGTLFIVIVPELLRDYVSLQHILFGLALVVMMAAAPEGLVPLARATYGIVVKRLRGAG